MIAREKNVSRITEKSQTMISGDISRRNVSSVVNMRLMFFRSSPFNGDLSKWNVSKVTDMSFMFIGASAFNRQLCGDPWVRAKADRSYMFEGSWGSISPTVGETAKPGHGGDDG